MKYVSIALCLLVLAQPALAESSLGREDVEEFCADPSRAQPPSTGVQFDGQPADERVMAVAAGRYELPENAAVLVFDSGAFLVRVKDYSGQVLGTDGDDISAPGGLVGGCSLEQLSEVMAKNGLDAALLTR